MDTDIGKSDWYLAIMIFLSGVKLVYQLRTLRKQVQQNPDMKENLEISSAVATLVRLDRYVTEALERIRKRS